jgi:hypothetical protein
MEYLWHRLDGDDKKIILQKRREFNTLRQPAS